MPREQITYPRIQGYLIDGPGNVTATPEPIPVAPQVHISWMPEREGGGFAQLMLEVDRAWLDNVLKDPPLAEDGLIRLFTETLMREELNKLIRVARRARDQAYGRDE